MTKLQNRGARDIFIACVDGLKGFPEAIESVFPKTQIQLCVVHLTRHSLKYVGWKERKEAAADLKAIYASSTAELAQSALERVERKWNTSYLLIEKSWRANWQRMITFFNYPPEIRKVIYTTNAIESLNMSLRKVIKTKGAFPHDEAVFKIFWLALRSISKKGTMPVKDWKAALNRCVIQFEEIRGRDCLFRQPPAQIPASGFPAQGSSHECLAEAQLWIRMQWGWHGNPPFHNLTESIPPDFPLLAPSA